MRIGIEAQRLFRPNKHGMEIVVLEIIKQLQRIDSENEYFIYVKKDKDICIKSSKNFTIREIGGISFAWWEQISLPKAVKKDNCQLLHCTSNTAPIYTNTPVLLTLHDIIYLEKSYLSIISGKGSFYQRYGNLYRKFIVPRIINKCIRIITVSSSEKKIIENYFILNHLNLDIIYNAVDNRFKHIDNSIELLNQLNISKPYILFHGNTDPKKNTENVFRAISILKKKYSIDINFVISDLKISVINKIAKETSTLEILDQIIAIGYISTEKLPLLYSSCELFLYPSLRESFGLPILEAMSCKTAVLTSAISSMPEVAGNAALLVDPESPEQLADGIAKILTDTDFRKELIRKGLENISRFSWEKAANETLKIYKEILT
ncbi:MAG: glycosyltransferase family 4 protein [Bacteroidales bacterium]